MTTSTELDKANLYRLPWSLTDNPIGWLEITDICNLYCKGCYRQRIEGHKSIEQIKEEIDFLHRVRNCDNITIAGGEPLVHPKVEEVVSYIRSKGLKAIMLTNGKAMTVEKLRALQAAGLNGMTFHIDQMQERKHWEEKNELELMAFRQKMVEIVRTVGGRPMHVSFGCTVYNENVQYLPEIVTWARANSDVVCGLVFIAFRAVPDVDDVQYQVGDKTIDPGEVIYSSSALDEIRITSYDIWDSLKQHFGEWRSAAYLDGTHDHDSIKWLITVGVLHGSEPVGFLGARGMELAQTKYHWANGRYFAYEPTNRLGKLKAAAASLYDSGIRQAFGRTLARSLNPFNWFKPIRMLSVGVVQAPDLLPNGDCDMCDSCPDMTVYNGKLYRSCRLDEVRKFGDFLKPTTGVAKPAAANGNGAVATERANV